MNIFTETKLSFSRFLEFQAWTGTGAVQIVMRPTPTSVK